MISDLFDDLKQSGAGSMRSQINIFGIRVGILILGFRFLADVKGEF